MKKILLLIILLTVLSCKEKTENHVVYSGNVENITETDSLISISSRAFNKNIKLSKNGSFSDTLNIKEAGYYSVLINKKNIGFVFLRNGFNLKLSVNKNKFFETTKYSGKGASSTNFLLAQYKLGKKIGNIRHLFDLEKDTFIKKVNNLKYEFDNLKKQFKDIDTMLIRINDKQNSDFFASIERNYEIEHAKIIQAKKLEKGKASPKFNNYLNFKGGKNSLTDFKGKYVFIDIWATWCKPCLAQVPSLKKLEKKYYHKNIEFVSISIDDKNSAGSWEDALTKWKKMIKDMNLTGVQLFAGKDIEFIKNYQAFTIPRFILIDTKGNIINANAPRPSDPSLIKIFDDLNL